MDEAAFRSCHRRALLPSRHGAYSPTAVMFGIQSV